MVVKATVKDNVIVPDEPLPFAEGTRLEVDVALEVRTKRGSPQAVLQLVGTLTHEEAEALRQAVAEMRRIDQSLWDSEQPTS